MSSPWGNSTWSWTGFSVGRRKAPRDIPLFSHPIIETHCHLDYLKEQDIPETLARSRAVGVAAMVTVSVAPDNMDTVLGVAKEYPGVYCSQGIHPHEAKHAGDEAFERLAHNGKEEEVVAVGEIGLDFYYDKSPRKRQREVFERQMELACELDLPVIIHSREADRESWEVLSRYAPKLSRRGVIHSFTSGKDFAHKALSLGFYLGFNGIITFNKADAVRDIVRLCPLEQILLETDAPFLAPTPYRGRENAPFYLPFVAQEMAHIKGCPVESVLEHTAANAVALFGNKLSLPLVTP